MNNWRDLGAGIKPGRHIFAIGDIHGMADTFKASLEAIARLPRPDASNMTQLVLLGDLIDRGPHGLECLELALSGEAADIANVDEVVFLPGNHELLLLAALEEAEADNGEYNNFLNSFRNGGDAVIMEYMLANDIDDMVEAVKGLVKAYLPLRDTKFLERTHYVSGDLLFVHAGLDPNCKNDVELEYFLSGGMPAQAGQDPDYFGMGWAWIRDDFLMSKKGWKVPGIDNMVVVHGHTPILFSDPVSTSIKDQFQAKAAEVGVKEALHEFQFTEKNVYEAALLEEYGRINLDSGCGKAGFNKTYIAEFCDRGFRMHPVNP